jgi:hypothetical protein
MLSPILLQNLKVRKVRNNCIHKTIINFVKTNINFVLKLEKCKAYSIDIVSSDIVSSFTLLLRAINYPKTFEIGKTGTVVLKSFA